MTDGSLLQRLFSLAGKTALITGAPGGIGQALAVTLAEAGATIGVHGRTPEKVTAACDAVAAVGGRAVPLFAELTDVESCRRLIQEAHAVLGRLDILINCAGMNRRKPIAEVTTDDFDTIMAVNLRSLFFLSQAAQPIMQAQGGGKIIHIGSMNSEFALDTVSVYGASKAGVAQLTRVMAVEWAKDNIQVNCIIPGFFRTPLTNVGLWQNERRSRWLHQRIPMRRPGEPEELAGVALLLASPASSYITGSHYIVDGGFRAGGSWETDPSVG
jgi:2-deoxy-D-gluconate 3-dehydrogenase